MELFLLGYKCKSNCVIHLWLSHFQQNLGKIIQRDFFPDVIKLNAQREFLEAEESGDMEKMREITIKFGSSLGKPSLVTPAPCKYFF